MSERRNSHDLVFVTSRTYCYDVEHNEDVHGRFAVLMPQENGYYDECGIDFCEDTDCRMFDEVRVLAANTKIEATAYYQLKKYQLDELPVAYCVSECEMRDDR